PLTVDRNGRPRRRAPSRAELRRYPWVAPRAQSPLRRRFEELVPQAESAVAAPIECNSLIAARAILVASDRLMLSSRRQVQHELASGELVALPHPDGEVVRAIGLTWRRQWVPTEPQQDFLDTLRRYAKSPSPSRERPFPRRCT
ncbi:MAG: LysR substrate-binding domain-containing protein, partial [Steroidobacteraceae bacterium]|nr:LysR substrate-binding domain-containing protein [Steroidobacteraceae bacterium]MDW8260759.1 LysR substrate-binding domain-containing protein [Gammaproteobacteria bacterium]